MQDYQPLDLAPFSNTGLDYFQPIADVSDYMKYFAPAPAIGSQDFHGLPFLIGGDPPNPAACFIGFGLPPGRDAAFTIPIRATARHIIVAHTLLESSVLQGDLPGRTVVHYVIRYGDGDSIRIPIRERFEVALVPMSSDPPFLCRPESLPQLMPRYEGQWEMMGQRQVGMLRALARGYYLWAWANPRPDEPIESFTIEPTGRKFVLAALTLSLLEEDPFCREGRRPVKITLPQAEDAARPFDLTAQVDRGLVTYPYALPQQSLEEFLGDPLKGWGQPQNANCSPAFVEVAAIPSATLSIQSGDQTLGQANWGQLQNERRVETPRVHFELLDRGRNWVHVSVVDDQTDCPLPCRVHFRSPEGIPYQPHGHHNFVNHNLGSFHNDVGGDLRLGQITYAYIDGRCQGWLPRGEVLVDAACGFEYEPLRTRAQIKPGQRELTLRLRRWTDQNQRRWFSGDSHVHFLGAQGAHLEAQAEGLNVVNLLSSQWGGLFTGSEDFTGRPSVSEDGRTIVYCSQENRQHLLGHILLWGLKNPVMPWCSGGPSEAELGGTLEEAMAYWADACHEQGGTVILPHFPNPNGEHAALIATGRADAIEMVRHGPYFHLEYYRYLNGGYRLPLVGGTDKMTSNTPVGLYRTYAWIPEDEPFNYKNWCSAVRAGRTFLSGGPMIEFAVNGARVGDTIELPAGGGTVELEASAESIFPIHTLQIVQQGRVIASTEEANGVRRLHLRAKVEVRGHTWLAARCGGPDYTAVKHHDYWNRGIFAHTSPIYIAVGGHWRLYDANTAQYMLTLVQGSLDYIRHTAPIDPPERVTHHHAMQDHIAYLEAPFREALEALHRRMHEHGVPH